jgi:hypothetical protein
MSDNQDQINPKLDPAWNQLSRKAKHRVEKFARGVFDIGIDDPEEQEITDMVSLNMAHVWVMWPVSDGISREVHSLIIRIYSYHSLRIMNK